MTNENSPKEDPRIEEQAIAYAEGSDTPQALTSDSTPLNDPQAPSQTSILTPELAPETLLVQTYSEPTTAQVEAYKQNYKPLPWPYTSHTGELFISYMLAKRVHTTKAAHDLQIPLDVISRWKRSQDFKSKLQQAEAELADTLISDIWDLADTLPSQAKDDVPGYTAAITAKKWLAEKMNPERYGSKAETDARPTVFNLDFGIKGKSSLTTVTPSEEPPVTQNNKDLDDMPSLVAPKAEED